VALTSLAKTMVITDDHRMRTEFGEEKGFDIFLCAELRKGFGKGDYDQMIDLLPRQEHDLFLQRIDQPDVFAVLDDFARMREEGDDHGLAVYAGGFFPKLAEDADMARVDTVEGTDRDD